MYSNKIKQHINILKFNAPSKSKYSTTPNKSYKQSSKQPRYLVGNGWWECFLDNTPINISMFTGPNIHQFPLRLVLGMILY